MIIHKLKQIGNLVRDISDPSLESFILDLNNNQLRLTFTENIKASAINLTLIYIHNSTSSTPTIPISGILLNSTGGPATDGITVVYVQLLNNTVVTLITNVNIGTTTSNTYLGVEAGRIMNVDQS